MREGVRELCRLVQVFYVELELFKPNQNFAITILVLPKISGFFVDTSPYKE